LGAVDGKATLCSLRADIAEVVNNRPKPMKYRKPASETELLFEVSMSTAPLNDARKIATTHRTTLIVRPIEGRKLAQPMLRINHSSQQSR
jgi:hypothetical protein